MFTFNDLICSFIWSKFSPFVLQTKCIIVLKYMIICIYTYGSTAVTIHSNVFLHLTPTLNAQQLRISVQRLKMEKRQLGTFHLQKKRKNYIRLKTPSSHQQSEKKNVKKHLIYALKPPQM